MPSQEHKKPYELLARGSYLEHQIRVRWTGRARKRSAEIEKMIDLAWRDRLHLAGGRCLFPGPLCRLARHSTARGILHLELGPTDYRELIGTNVCHPEIAQAYGHDYLSNALAVHSTVVTVDRKILLFQRSADVGEYPGAYDVCGGHLDPISDLAEGAPRPFHTLRRELEEEIGLRATEIESAVCRGLIRNATTLKPDLIFGVWTRLSWADFERHALDAEHRRMQCIDDSAEDIARFLRDYGGNMAPAGVAALELHWST